MAGKVFLVVLGVTLIVASALAFPHKHDHGNGSCHHHSKKPKTTTASPSTTGLPLNETSTLSSNSTDSSTVSSNVTGDANATSTELSSKDLSTTAASADGSTTVISGSSTEEAGSTTTAAPLRHRHRRAQDDTLNGGEKAPAAGESGKNATGGPMDKILDAIDVSGKAAKDMLNNTLHKLTDSGKNGTTGGNSSIPTSTVLPSLVPCPSNDTALNGTTTTPASANLQNCTVVTTTLSPLNVSTTIGTNAVASSTSVSVVSRKKSVKKH